MDFSNPVPQSLAETVKMPCRIQVHFGRRISPRTIEGHCQAETKTTTSNYNQRIYNHWTAKI